uniref:Reg-2-like protein n=1 Tax=Ixodes ricinus TaxID=34613 RepID=V5GW39_IXORI
MVSRFRLITFDATNTLLRFRESVGQAYSGVAHMYGVTSDPKRLNASFRTEWKKMIAEHPNFGCGSGLTSQQWWSQLVRRTFLLSGCNAADSLMTAIASHLYESYKTSNCWTPNNGSADVLENLKISGHKLGVISNTDERLDCILTQLKLRHYFDFVIASSVVKVEKPSKDIFSLALLCASSERPVKPEDALHVGDSVELDYLASKAAGWSALLLVNHDDDAKKVAAKNAVEPSDVIYRLSDVVKKAFEVESYQATEFRK